MKAFSRKIRRLFSVVCAVAIVLVSMPTWMTDLSTSKANSLETNIVEYQETYVDLTDYLNWRAFAPNGGPATEKGLTNMYGGNYTLCSCDDCLQSTTINFNRVNYKLHENVKSTAARADGCLSENDCVSIGANMDIPVLPDGQSMSASKVNVLVGASGAGVFNTDIQFVVGYDDGTFDSVVTAKAVPNSTAPSDDGGTWNISNANMAYASPYINWPNSVHAFGQGNLTAFSFDVNPEKKVKTVGIFQNYAAVLFAITLQTPVYEYPDGVLAYETESVSLNYNFRYISDNHANAAACRGSSYQTLYVPEYDEDGNTVTPSDLAEYNTNPDKEPYLKDNTYTVKGIPYTLGPTEAGANNVLLPNAGKQTIPVKSGEMKSIHIVMALVNNVAIEHGWFEVNYSDGSVSKHNYLCLDQHNRFNTSGNNPNIALRGLIAGETGNAQTSFYEISLTPDEGKEVVSVTLPQSDSALYVSMTAVRIVREREKVDTNVVEYKETYVDLTDYLNWRAFAPNGGPATNKGLTNHGNGANYTLCSCDECLKSTTLNFNRVNYQLHENVKSTAVGTDGYLSENDCVSIGADLNIPVLPDGQSMSASRVNVLVGASGAGTPNTDIQFVVGYDDGTFDNVVTAKAVWNSTDRSDAGGTWNILNTNMAYASPYINTLDSVHAYGDQGNLTAFSFDVNPEKKIKTVGIFQNYAAVLFAITLQTPVYEYPDGVKAYEPESVSLNYNFRNISDSHANAVAYTSGPSYQTLYVPEYYVNGKTVTPEDLAEYNTNPDKAPYLKDNTYTFKGIPYTLGPTEEGANNVLLPNAGKQTISIESGEMKSIHIVMTLVNNVAIEHGWFEVNYADGSVSEHNYLCLDQQNRYNTPGNNPNIALRGLMAGRYDNAQTSFYEISLTPDAGKEVVSVTLPESASALYVSMTAVRIVRESEKAEPAEEGVIEYKETYVDLTDYLNWRAFAPNGGPATNKGLTNHGNGVNYTLCSCDECLKSTTINFNRVNYQLHENVKSTVVGADGLLSENDCVSIGTYLNIPVSSDGQSISASRVNVLVGASGAGTPNTDIQFVVGYDDGSLESVVTAKAVWNSTDRSDAGGTWNILNTNIAYASPYINTLDSVHAYGDQGNLTAFSFDVNPEKKVKNIRIIQNYAAVLFAITLQTPVYEYPDGVLAYEPENVHLNYNFRDISDSHENAVDFTSGPSYQTLYVPEYDENGNTITPNDLAEYNTNPDKAPYLKDNTYTFKGIPYTLGSTEEGANNVLLPNAGKQTIPIRSGEMKAIHIVMTLVNNVAIEHGWIEVNYADGSVSQHNYLCLDQENRYNTPGNNPNIALRGLIAGRYDNAQTNFYEISLTPDAGKEVVSVTLPESMSALYVSMTAVRVIKENEISQNNTKQIHVDLSKDFDYKSFSVKENHKTLEGFGYDHTTFAGDVDILKSLQVDFNGISYKLSENARSADMTKKDSVHVTGQYLTLRGEARTNANSVNLLMSVWDTNKKDLKFTVIYTDGDQETVTVPYMRPVTMWGDPNTAAYLNGAYTYTYDSNTGKMVEGESPLQTLAMLAVSIPTNPEKQLDCIKLPEVTSVVGSLNYRTTQAVVFAVTVVAPINRYDEAAEGEKQLRGYLPVPLDLSGLANSNNLSSTHDGETDVFAFANDEWCTICQEHFYTVKYENGKAVKDQPITGDSFTYNGIPYYFVPEGNYANGRANARDISCYAGAVTIPMGSNTGSMRSINLLTAVNGGYPIHDWIEIQYTDGTSDYRRFYTPDWVHSAEDGPFHDGISYYDTINNPNVAIISDIGGGDNTGYKGRGMSIYSISLFPDTEKEVSAIVLPQRAEPIYLAVTVERAVYGDPYTDQDPKNNKPAKWTDPGYKYTTVDLPYNVNAFATADRMEAGNFDGNGLRSFSADGLTRDFSFKGVPYRLGNLEYGYYNAVRPWFQEERFYVAPGHYQSLNMLYSAFLDDKINFNIELIFSDGSTQMCDFGYTEDWSSGSKYGMAESIAINNGYYMPKEYTLCSEYTKVNGDAKIYGGTVYLTPENTKKTLTEIRIPKEGNEYSLVFAMTLYGNRTGKAPETIDNRPDGVISNGVQDRIDSYVGVKVITDGNGNGSGQMPVEDGNSILWIILAVLAVVLCALLGAIFVLLHKKNKTDKIKE